MVTFERTTCACDECRACCKRQPGYLIPDDIERISEHMGESVLPFLVASPGAVVAKVTPNGIQMFRVGTIVPKTVDAGGRCVFLDEDECCVIHEVAPFGCAMFDTHQKPGEWEERSHWGIEQTMEMRYQKLREALPKATTYNPMSG